jgi:hypothetical protein
MKIVEDIVFEIGEGNRRSYRTFPNSCGYSSSNYGSTHNYAVHETCQYYDVDIKRYVTVLIVGINHSQCVKHYDITPTFLWSDKVRWKQKTVSGSLLFRSSSSRGCGEY